MGRARRARRIAQVAAYGGGWVAGTSLLGYGVLRAEAALARRVVGRPFEGAPDDEGEYGAGIGEPISLLMLGDSTARGMGADTPRQTIGAIVASGVSAFAGRAVHLTNAAVIGAESGDLDRQITEALERAPSRPAVAIILVGANDVTHRIDRATAVRHLEEAVRRLRALDIEVVVGTCPDLGTVRPVAQPLRLLARRLSRDLAAAQTVAVVEAGGRSVSLVDLLGTEFYTHHQQLFSQDRFHPSPAGYARVASALLPSVSAALDLFGERTSPEPPRPSRGEGVRPVAAAATAAAQRPGTEVSGADVAGQARGPHGRWAVLMRRVRRSPAEDTVQDTARGTALDTARSTAQDPAPSGGGGATAPPEATTG